MQPDVSENLTVYREPIDGAWESVRAYLQRFDDGPAIEEGLRTKIMEVAAKWSAVSEESSFYVLFQVPKDPEWPAFSWA
ncbi:MAG TPA: hypothetical protein VFA47_09990, partial [Candidatus Manganitrophaceae bacterium]|nr:hypothetical protein [Candidatus Manganitrophaceae bacterium]